MRTKTSVDSLKTCSQTHAAILKAHIETRPKARIHCSSFPLLTVRDITSTNQLDATAIQLPAVVYTVIDIALKLILCCSLWGLNI